MLLLQTKCIVLTPLLMRQLGSHHGYMDVIDSLIAQGFEFVGGRMVWFTQEHFLCSIEAASFQQVPMLVSGPCLVLALQRDNAVLAFDTILRETFSTESSQGKSVTDSLLQKYGRLILRLLDLKQMQDSDSDLDLQSCLGNAVSNISSIRETFSPKKRKPRIMKEKKVPGPSCGVSRILPYLLPPASKPPRFRGEADKDLIKDHCDAGYGYPQNPGQTSGRPKSVSLSYDMDTDEFYQFSVGLFPNLQGKVVSMYKMDKQRRLITVTPSLPSALRDNSYTGVTFFKGDEHTEDPGPVVGNPNPIEPIAERRAIIAVQDQAFEEALAEDRKKAQIEDEKKIQLQQQKQRLKQIHEDSLRITGEEPMGGVAIKV
ncbi:uncharacterized protein LOC123560687 [Mercenaria mercenaria]|uniref:uncharacterized protein LOC123560687 n=1 Tax=Mercenaria mercenaria TaxID=6596 RepID=UPI00234F6773|nr:uncharacterized protein LOC123560687 [Mercenaria mercenaria]